ncbi:MAG: recombinase family protein [Clostridia bacterium]
MNKPKVAIYARVSTESLEQDGSFEAQQRYFTEKYKDKYEIVEIYAEKKSGTNIKNRDEFQKLLKDAGLELEHKKGNINLYNTNKEPKFNYILVKSVSRLSRNTETVTIIRKLKAQGVYIIYDDINKTTESEDDEMLLSIMQTVAQQESVEKSRIVRWGIKRSAEANMIRMSSIPFGYDRVPNENRLLINEKEAEIVKYVYELYVNEDKGARAIKQMLDEKGYKNREGKSFTERSLLYMVQNCKYCGINLRNRYTSNDLYNKNSRIELSEEEWIKFKNERIPIIISEEMFDKAQQKLESRRANGRGYRGFTRSPFAKKFVCECGGNYIHNKFKNGDKEAVGFYVCNRRKKMGKAKSGCSSRNILESELDEVIEEYLNGKYKKILDLKIGWALREIEEKYEKANSLDLENVSEKLHEINIKLKKNSAKLNKLMDMLLDSSSTKEDVINSKMKKIEDENKNLESEKAELDITINQKNLVLKNLTEASKMLNKIKDKNLDGTISREKFIEDISIIKLNKKDKIEITTTVMSIMTSIVLTTINFKGENTLLKNWVDYVKPIVNKEKESY